MLTNTYIIWILIFTSINTENKENSSGRLASAYICIIKTNEGRLQFSLWLLLLFFFLLIVIFWLVLIFYKRNSLSCLWPTASGPAWPHASPFKHKARSHLSILFECRLKSKTSELENSLKWNSRKSPLFRKSYSVSTFRQSRQIPQS